MTNREDLERFLSENNAFRRVLEEAIENTQPATAEWAQSLPGGKPAPWRTDEKSAQFLLGNDDGFIVLWPSGSVSFVGTESTIDFSIGMTRNEFLFLLRLGRVQS